jgi:hypothetical protein
MVHTTIGRNRGATAQQNSVTRYQQSSIHDGPLAIRLTRGCRFEARFESRNRVSGLAGLVKANGCVDKLNNQQDSHVQVVCNGDFNDNRDLIVLEKEERGRRARK